MIRSLPANPAISKALISHLVTWGEVATCELASFSASSQWLSVLSQAGVIDEVSSGKATAWALSSRASVLFDLDLDAALKTALFQVSTYRRYLLGILAEGLITAAKEEMLDHIEKWSGDVLLPLLGEINEVIDGLEKSGRLIEQSSKTINQLCDKLPERSFDWTNWNQFLLGQTGRPQELFDFALKRFAPYSFLSVKQNVDRAPTLIRQFPLNTDDGFDLAQPLKPAPWNTRRFRARSSLALFDEHCQSLIDAASPFAVLGTLQNILLDHPFYKAVVHLAIIPWRFSASNSSSIEIYMPPGAPLADVSVIVSDREVGRLADLLPELVALQGFNVCGLDAGSVPSDLMANMIKNLLTLNILSRTDDSLELNSEFKATLMAARLRTIFRPGKQFQERMLAVLSQRQTGVLQNG